MPRITNQEHYRRHCFLRMLWCDPGLNIFFALLSVSAQWQLHEYYRPAEDLNEAEFKRHCQAIVTKAPQLRHVVGKHFKVIEDLFVAASKAFGVDQAQMRQAVAMAIACNDKTLNRPKPKDQTRSSRSGSSNIGIAAIAKPLDIDKLGTAFLILAGHMTREKVGGDFGKK